MLVDDSGEKWLERLERAEDEVIEKRLLVLREVKALSSAAGENKTLLNTQRALLVDREAEMTTEISEKKANKIPILTQLSKKVGEAEEKGVGLQNELEGLMTKCTTDNAAVVASTKPKLDADIHAFEMCKTLMATLSWTSGTGTAPSTPAPPPRPPKSWTEDYATCDEDDINAFFGKVSASCQQQFQVMLAKPSGESKIDEDIKIICPCVDDITVDDMKEIAKNRIGPLLCKPTNTSDMSSFHMWKYCREQAGKDVVDSDDLAYGKPLRTPTTSRTASR